MSSGGAMPTSVESWAADTSVAVAALDASHVSHAPCREAVQARRPSLSGHATFETYSVLTRLPGQLMVDAPTASSIIRRVFPSSCWLEPAASDELFARLGAVGIVGGAVYDALVGEAARVNGRRLLTRDQRARRTYALLGVTYEFVGK
jgi:predicted nucleic acid-binding protein